MAKRIQTKGKSSLYFGYSGGNAINFPIAAFAYTYPMTAMAWVKLVKYGTSNVMIWGRAVDADPQNTPYDLVVLSDGRLGLAYEYGSGTNVSCVSSSVVPLGQWVHVAYTIDASLRVKLYLNGVVVYNQVQANAPQDTTGTYTSLGYDAGAGHDALHGNLFDPRIAGFTFTDAQVQEAMLGATIEGTAFQTDNVQGTYGVLTDITGNGNHGTFVGSVAWSLDVPSVGRASVLDIRSSFYPTVNALSPVGSVDTTSAGTGGTMSGWVMANAYNGTTAFRIWDATATLDVWRFNLENATGYPFIWQVNSAGSGSTLPKISSTGIFPLRQWVHVAVTMYNDGTTMTGEIYLNGRLAGRQTYGGARDTRVGSRFGIDASTTYQFSRMRCFNKRLSALEVFRLYAQDMVPKDGSLKVEWLGGEGINNTLNDTSGNGNHSSGATIAWSSNTPFKRRIGAGKPFLPNMDFMQVPLPYTAATNVGDRVIDGTAAGSVMGTFGSSQTDAKRIFGWKTNFYSCTAPFGINYDTNVRFGGKPSMHFFGVDVKERVHAHASQRNYADSNSAFDIQANMVPIKPNTMYKMTVTGKVRVTAKTGDPFNPAVLASGAASARAYIHTASGYSTLFPASFLETDTEETKKTIYFATPSNARYLSISMGMFGNGTDYWSGEMWLGDIQFDEVDMGTVRQLVKGNLIQNGDFAQNTVQLGSAVDTTSFARWIDGTAAGNANAGFGWYLARPSGTGSAAAGFDTGITDKGGYSMKLTAQSNHAAGIVAVRSVDLSGASWAFRAKFIRVRPNTQYTISGYYKTKDVTAGGGGSGACMKLSQGKPDGSWTGYSTIIPFSVTGSNPTTFFTHTFTTGATSAFLLVEAQLDNSDGTLWVDKLTLEPVTPIAPRNSV